MSSIHYQILLTKLGLAKSHHHELQNSLTHSSYHTKEDNLYDNSRFIFLGMTQFKGVVAKIMYNYVPGSGTQLQHIHGNLFNNTKLHGIYDALALRSMIRAGINFDIEAHKHIFVYGIFGLLAAFGEESTIHRFIFKYMLDKHDVTPIHKKQADLPAQLQALSQMKTGQKAKYTITKNDDKTFTVSTKLQYEILSSHTSKSLIYARKQATKKALVYLADRDHQKLQHDEEYMQTLEKKSQIQVVNKRRSAKERLMQNMEHKRQAALLRKEKVLKLAEEKQNRDNERRLSKARKKTELELKRKETMAKAPNKMSIKKRKHLEDKMK